MLVIAAYVCFLSSSAGERGWPMMLVRLADVLGLASPKRTFTQLVTLSSTVFEEASGAPKHQCGSDASHPLVLLIP
jgi:hypothetical protein